MHEPPAVFSNCVSSDWTERVQCVRECAGLWKTGGFLRLTLRVFKWNIWKAKIHNGKYTQSYCFQLRVGFFFFDFSRWLFIIKMEKCLLMWYILKWLQLRIKDSKPFFSPSINNLWRSHPDISVLWLPKSFEKVDLTFLFMSALGLCNGDCVPLHSVLYLIQFTR